MALKLKDDGRKKSPAKPLPPPLEAEFQQAMKAHQRGQLAQAQGIYDKILKSHPKHFGSLHMLGIAAFQTANHEQAVRLIGKAIRVDPQVAPAHSNLALALEGLGRPAEALASYDRALALDPNYVDALNNRGTVLQELGRPDEALASFDKALRLDAGHIEAHNNKGNALRTLGRAGEAVASYDRAIALRPGYADAYNNRGNALRELQRLREAGDSYDRAIALDPHFAEAFNGRGLVFTALRQFDRAIDSFGRTLARRPNHAQALANRASALIMLNRLPEAMSDAERAIALAPSMAEGWTRRAIVLLRLERVTEAVASSERAVALDPRSALAQVTLGHGLLMLGRTADAIAAYDAALALKPDFEEAISSRIFAFDFVAEATFEQHQRVRAVWWERIGAPIAARAQHRNVRDPDRRLVVGYVSADFRDHSAGLSFKPVLQHTDKAVIESICYACSPIEDSVTRQFQAMAGRWRDASQWDDDTFAGQIAADGVDILVDLAGHTGAHRLSVFARKPAPIQVHGWGHGTPPGLPTIDYVFSDPVAIPAAARPLFRETICDLPCVITLDPLPAEVPRSQAPVLQNGCVTFGMFNRISKMSDAAAAAWADILRRTPGAKLMIKSAGLEDAAVRDALLARFAALGVAADRIVLHGATSRAEHLAALNDVDICLDPFPQSGGVSTWEALQMGVPVLTLLGANVPGRISGAILGALDLMEWVAEDVAGYVDAAVAHAADIDRLSRLRSTLPQRIAASAAGNPAAYADAVTRAYRAMWREYCSRAAT